MLKIPNCVKDKPTKKTAQNVLHISKQLNENDLNEAISNRL